MKNISKAGLILAVLYLIPVLIPWFLLISEGVIHHGTGIYFLPAFVLTLPWSFISFAVTDRAYNNQTPFLLSMVILLISALINAFIIYQLAGIIERAIRKPANRDLR